MTTPGSAYRRIGSLVLLVAAVALLAPASARSRTRSASTLRLAGRAASVRADALAHTASDAKAPPVYTSFDGISNLSQGLLSIPPGTTGDVGPEHYVQQVNSSFGVFSKAGDVLAGPTSLAALFSALPGSSACESPRAVVEPYTLYDSLSDRFVLTMNTGANTCIAVSQTNDPTGAYHLYDFVWPFAKTKRLARFGLWNDGLYMSVAHFAPKKFAGMAVAAFDKAAMYAGKVAGTVAFDLKDGLLPDEPLLKSQTLLPGDLDGPIPPPPGVSNPFAGLFASGQIAVWEFDPDFEVPGNSKFAIESLIDIDEHDHVLCKLRRKCIPQPKTKTKLDASSFRLMSRNAYRNFGTHQAMMLNTTIDVGPKRKEFAAVQWYEIRRLGDGWALHQEGTQQNASGNGPFDGTHRWIGAIAQDERGNTALGYSASSKTTFPSIRYAGRLADDPPDEMAQGESALLAGTGSQAAAKGFGKRSKTRWGDVSSMTVDPADDCTFWYTNQYYDGTGAKNGRIKDGSWRTRIGRFRFQTCVEDVDASLSIDDVTVDEGDTARFTISISPPSTSAVSVNLATSDGSAVAPDDYDAVALTQVVIPPNQSSVTQTVATNDDDVAELDETFDVILSEPSANATVADGRGVGTIVDDDGGGGGGGNVRELSISDAAVTEGGDATFTVSASNPGAAVSVNAATADGTAVAGADYVDSSAVVQIGAGQTSATFVVSTLQDTVFEGTETFTVNLSSPSQGALIGDGTGIGTINDDDLNGAARRRLSVADASATEGDVMTFVIEASAGTETATVNVATSDQTAVAGSDYTPTNTTVTIPGNSTSVNVQVPTIEDAVAESPETFRLDLSSPSANADITDGQAIGTISDDDGGAQRQLSIGNASAQEGDVVTFQIQATNPGQQATVNVATSNGTALAGSDYVTTSATVTIPANASVATLQVPTIEDAVPEGSVPETFRVDLSSPSANAVIASGSADGSIIDDDVAVREFTVNDVSAAEGDTLSFTISATNPGQAVSVNVATADGAAQAGTDYTAKSEIVTIPANATVASFSVATIEDAVVEPDETLTVNLSAPSANASISDDQGTGTITNDDVVIRQISVNNVSVNEGNQAIFTISATDPGQSATVNVATSDGTATAGADYTQGSATFVIPADASSVTFAVATLEDDLVEANEKFTVNLTAPSANASISDGQGVGTIVDDDPTRVLSINDAQAIEGDQVSFTITATNPGRSASVDFTTSNGTATSGSDYRFLVGTFFIPSNLTSIPVVIETFEDTLDEPNETFNVTLSAPSANASIGDGSGVGTIVDDDPTRVLSVSDAPAVTEGANASFVITATNPGEQATVFVATENVTAVAPGDYDAVSRTVTIPANATTVNVDVSTNIDAECDAETQETFRVRLSAPSANASISDGLGVGRINNLCQQG